MKIVRNFLFNSIIFIIISFFIIAFFSSFFLIRLKRYIQVNDEIKRIENNIKTYQDTINRLLIYPIENISIELESAKKNFEKQYEKLIRKISLIPEFKKDLEQINVIMIKASSYFIEILNYINQLSGYPEFGEFLKEGIIYKYNLLSENKGDFSYFMNLLLKNRAELDNLLNEVNNNYFLMESVLKRKIHFLTQVFIIFIFMLIVITLFLFRIFFNRWRNKVIFELEKLIEYTNRLVSDDFSEVFLSFEFDEISELIKAIRENISYMELLIQIRNNSEEIQNIYLKIKNVLGDFLEKNSNYTKKIINVSTLLEELLNSILFFYKRSKDIKLIAEEVKDKVTLHGNHVRTNISEIQKLTTPANKIIESLKFITKITEETGLLSLNAAIESAKAGERGKGFRVVAMEVGKLAEVSSQSTTDVVKLVEEIIVIIEKINLESRDSIEALFSIERSLQEVIKFFDETALSIENETGISKAISDSVAQINRLIERTDKIIAENISLYNGLSKELTTITNVINKFKF